jgi:hypothetical protein
MTILYPFNPVTIVQVAMNTLPFAFGAAICIREQRYRAGENFDDIDADLECETNDRVSRRSGRHAALKADPLNADPLKTDPHKTDQ